MAYKLELRATPLHDDSYIIDERAVNSDEELMAFIGKFAVWYFLAIASVDWRDAYFPNGIGKAPDTLLAFTCDKETDKPEPPHRHGLPKGLLAYGEAWPDGQAVDVQLNVRRAE